MAQNNPSPSTLDIEQMPQAMQEDTFGDVASWLARLVLLYGVPFNYLIPEEQMLPKESLRFFFLDPIWIQCLVQGACSVGSNGYGDRIIDKAMNEWVQPNQPEGKNQTSLTNKRVAGVRDRLRSQYEDIPLSQEDNALDWPLTGFLLRSAVVEGWRGLEVMAYRNLTEPEKQKLTDALSGKARDILDGAITNEEQRDALRTEMDVLRKQSPTETEKLLTPTELEDVLYQEWTDEKTTKRKAELGGAVQAMLDRAAANRAARDQLRSDLRNLLREQKPEELKTLLTLAGVATEEELLKLLVELVTPLKPFRIEQLSKDVMLGLFNGIIAQLVIRQPQEGLHFGFTNNDKFYTKTLRELGYREANKTGEVLNDLEIDLATKRLAREQTQAGVIKIAKLAAMMKTLLEGERRLEDGKFTSAEFAVEMIEAAGEFTFRPAIRTLP